MKGVKIIVIAMTCLYLSSCDNQTVSVNSDITIPVKVTPIELTSIQETLSANGTVGPVSEAELSTQSQGYYQLQVNPRTGKPFTMGDAVNENEVIIQLNYPELVNSVRIEIKKMNLKIAESDYRKQKTLHEKGGVTASDLQEAEVNYINTKYDYEAAQMDLEDLLVKAPFDGVIVDLPYYTQNVKVESGTAILSVMNYENLVLSVDFPEKYISSIRSGMSSIVTSYSIENSALEGEIDQISPAIDEETRTFKGIVKVDNPDLSFRPGMYVKADIITHKVDSTIVVPRDILKKGRRGGYVVYVVERNTAAAEKRVSTGIESDGMIQITKGLSVGDLLVTDGYEMLSNRSKVKVIK